MSVTDGNSAPRGEIIKRNSPQALLDDLKERGYQLSVSENGKLAYDGPPITPVIWHALQANYNKLVRLLGKDEEDVTVSNVQPSMNVIKDNTDWSKVANLAPRRGEDLDRAIAEHAAMNVEADRRVKANPPEGADPATVAGGVDIMIARWKEERKIGRPGREAEAERRVEASKQGGACAKCGRVLEDGEKAYLKVRTFVGMWGSVFGARIGPRYDYHTVCEDCAPRSMVERPRYREYTIGDKTVQVPASEHYDDAYCETCARPVVYQYAGYGRRRGSHIFCCYRCQYTYHNRRRAEREQFLREKTCEVCGNEFTATRAHAKTCSKACKQKAYRQRRQQLKVVRTGAPRS